MYQVLEETGYNLAGQLDPENVIELTIKEQKISLFMVPGVPEDFNFQTKTRKEISVRRSTVYTFLYLFTHHRTFSKLHGLNYRICRHGREANRSRKAESFT